MKRVIHIIQKDLSDTACDRVSNEDCLIARAVKRIVKPRTYVGMGVTRIRIGRAEIKVPARIGLRVFTARKPFKFTLDIPKKYLATSQRRVTNPAR